MRRCLVLVIVALTFAGCRPLVPLLVLDLDMDPTDAFVSSIDPVTVDMVPHSWRPGCPVAIEDLRLISASFWGFDARTHQGELVVHVDHAEGLVGVLSHLYSVRFPIERMELVDAYEGDDDASMAANNTSAFNCREVSRRPGVWSQHAYGTAIDINPAQNPYILRDGTVLPPKAVTDRETSVTGLITADGPVVAAFAAIGWGWGGSWTGGVLDYQHFSASGR